jgi:hypothetical protein
MQFMSKRSAFGYRRNANSDVAADVGRNVGFLRSGDLPRGAEQQWLSGGWAGLKSSDRHSQSASNPQDHLDTRC